MSVKQFADDDGEAVPGPIVHGLIDLSALWQRPHAPMSPDNGPLVKLFDGVYHADPVTEEMEADGTFLRFTDFQQTVEAMGLYKSNAGQTFYSLYGWLHEKATESTGRYGYDSPYHVYSEWGTNYYSERRAQLLLETQAVADKYERDVNMNRLPDNPNRLLTRRQLRVVRFVLRDY